MASTAQEVLIAELLGDIGRLHDQVKALPDGIKEAITPALGALVTASKEAQERITKLGVAQGNAVVRQVESESARLRTDLQREHMVYREATKEALREIIGNTIESASSSLQDARRSILVPVWIAAIGSGVVSGTVVALATSVM